MKVQLIGGPCAGAWAEVSKGQRTLTIGHLDAVKADALPEDAPSFNEYHYRLTTHDNNTQTFEYQG